MAQETREELAYEALQNMARNVPRFSKTLTPGEWAAARKRVEENRAKGYRIDGAPATANIYGVMRRTMNAAPAVHLSDERVEQRDRMAAALEKLRKEKEAEDAAGSNGEGNDSAEPERRAGKADNEAGADGVRAKAAGRDRERGDKDRGTAQKAAGGGGKGKDREQARARVKEKKDGAHCLRGLGKKAPDLSAESRAAIYDEYANGATVIALKEKYGMSRYHVEQIIDNEAGRRGVEKPKHIGRPEPRLNADEQAQFYLEYVTMPVSVDELSRKWGIGNGAAWRYIQKARLNGTDAEKDKPRKSRRTLQLSDEQIRELARRRDMGESTEKIAGELGVSKYALRSEFRRVVGKSKHGHNTLTAEDKAELVNKYKAGVRYRELARLYHISSQTITQILDAAGIAQRGTNPRKGITTSEVAERIEFPALGKWMEEQGMSICTLAERIGTSVPTTYRWLTQGDSKHMTKGAIDTLMEMTGLTYEEAFGE